MRRPGVRLPLPPENSPEAKLAPRAKEEGALSERRSFWLRHSKRSHGLFSATPHYGEAISATKCKRATPRRNRALATSQHQTADGGLELDKIGLLFALQPREGACVRAICLTPARIRLGAEILHLDGSLLRRRA